jgi:alkylation response protein AidB-like acyl-CoA dehydrogenase
MSIFSTERTRELLPRIHQFVENELISMEQEGFLQMPFDATEQMLQKKRNLVKAAGLWGLQWSVEEGGHGLSLCEFGQVSELLAWSPWGHYAFNCQAPDIGNMELLHTHASEELKKEYLHPLKEGEIRSCFAMTEPQNAGSNPVNLSTLAVREGDHYRINGHKWFTSSADGAVFAVVMAVTNPEAAAHQRASQIVVPTDAKGFRLVRNIPVMGEAGSGWLSHAEIILEDVMVPVSNRIGAEGAGFALAQQRLGPGRIHHCMRWIGIAERSLDLMCRRALQRDMGDGQRLGDKQIIQSFIAESRAEINAARLHVLNTAYLIDNQGAAAVRDDISAIKFNTAAMMLRVVDRAIQAHGALGVTDDTVLSFFYRHERAARIYDGADEVHKMALARSILKKYG